MGRTAKFLVIFLAALFIFSSISPFLLADKPEQTGQDKNKEKKQKKDRDQDGDDDPDDDGIMDEDEEQESPPAKGLYKAKNTHKNEVKAKLQLQNTFRSGAIRELIQDEFQASFEDLEIESPLLPENITADVEVYIIGNISGSKVTTPSGRCNLQVKILDASGLIILDSSVIMTVEIVFGMLNMHSQGDESENSVDAFFRAKYLEVTDSINNPLLPEDLILENALIRIRDGQLYFVGPEDNGSPAPPRSDVRITTFARIKSGQQN